MSILNKIFGTGKQVVLYVDKGEWVDGVVVDESGGEESFAQKAWNWFNSNNHNRTVGGNDWEESYRNPNFQDRGQVFNPSTGEMEYRVDCGQNRRPTYLEQTLIDGYGDDRATG